MPRVKLNKIDYLVRDRIKNLHGRLLAQGLKNVDVAKWLGCSPQNVGYHFRHGTFSYRQIVTIEEHLQEALNHDG